MLRILFVSNGHGEASIAQRIARELSALSCAALEHLPLVYGGEEKAEARAARLVGPYAAMPSGGLVAMGNVRAFARDLQAGFLRLFAQQTQFLRERGKEYACVVAVGDAYALAMALLAGRSTSFVGTAKSVYVAEYGRFERFLLRKARHVFVRDERTAAFLRDRNVQAQAPGNVIVDLGADGAQSAPPPGEWIGVLPGSREAAYEDGVRLARIVRAMGAHALFSIAPGLESARFESLLAADGWSVRPVPGCTEGAFEASASGARLLAWVAGLGSLLRASRLVLGQAGTANEAAASCGIPVVALETNEGQWYRMRQQRLLGEALTTVPVEPEAAARAVRALLADRARLERMGAIGRERMGKPGGARAVAAAIAEACA